MLLENFLKCAEEVISLFEREGKEASLHAELVRLSSLIDPEEFDFFPSLKEYLEKFLLYFSPLDSLPRDRRMTRIENGHKMIDKLREIFLVRSEEEVMSLLGKPVAAATSIKYATSVGESRSKILKRMGIETAGDLVNYFPRDYEDRRTIVPISSIVGEEKVSIKGKLLNYSVKKVSGYTIISAVVSDGFGQILLKWFNQDYILQRLVKDRVYLIHGTAKKTPFGPLEMNSPEIEKIEGEVPREILPVYSLTSGISMNMMRKIMKRNLGVVKSLDELLPDFVRHERDLMSRRHAMISIHFPLSLFEMTRARKYLVYEEFFLFELAILYNRSQLRKSRGGIAKTITGELSKRLIARLPFELTGDQIKVFEEIREDMRSSNPMNRLLQGDVGSGKTMVAELAMVDNFEAGYQSALMVPTSVLAMQHFEKLSSDLEPLGIKVELLTGSLKKSEQDRIRLGLVMGEIDIVIGTHSLIQEGVDFENLGLIVVDEQHRFGVRQREALTTKGHLVDSLIMTATPIPRTLAMTAYGDLDVSTIITMPKGRNPVRTLLISRSRTRELYSFIMEELKMGHQIFFIYPLVEESEQIDLKNATDEAERLRSEIFPDVGVELLHGRMSDLEKQEVMGRFRSKESMILVSTTVVEVGIDVPSATVMVIEHPERFGLAQLHQLRGRVGRSSLKSYCIMVLNSGVSKEALDRLRDFSSTSDGFTVAELDLKLRGPGEFMGLRQHGLPQFSLGDILRDSDLLTAAREDAAKLLRSDPDLQSSGALRLEIEKRFSDSINLIEVG